MSQFSVHRMRNARGTEFPLVDIQSNILSHLTTRVVVPLYRAARSKPAIARLNPSIPFDGEIHVFATQEMAAVPAKLLGPSLGDVSAHRDAIIAAVDLLVTGI